MSNPVCRHEEVFRTMLRLTLWQFAQVRPCCRGSLRPQLRFVQLFTRARLQGSASLCAKWIMTGRLSFMRNELVARISRRLRIGWVAFGSVLAASVALADIYTCRHPNGSIEITDSPCARGATTLSVLRSLRTAVANPPAASPAGELSLGTNKVQTSGYATTSNGATRVTLAARVDPNQQRNRDDIRRRVLTNELEMEEKLLAEARAAYNGGNIPTQANEPVNSPAYLERRARLQQAVALHEKNVAAIRQELSNLR